MRRLLHQLRSDDRGISLPELLVSTLVTSLTLVVLVTWVQAVGNVNAFQEADFDALNEIRFAKSEMVKELRFADDLLASGPDVVSIWVDLDDSGANDLPEETITWEIAGDTLIRYTNNDLLTAVVRVDVLDGASSGITVTGTSVEMVFVADINATSGPDARTVQTEVELRNVLP